VGRGDLGSVAVTYVRAGRRSAGSTRPRPLFPAHPSGAPIAPEARFVLARIMEGTVEMIVAILAAHEEPAAIREAFRAFWRFQLAGLQSLLAGDGPDRR
jgi:hypothetical protein